MLFRSYTHKTPEQAERELIYRALLEMKSDIMDIKHLLGQRQPAAESLGSHYVEAKVDTDDGEPSPELMPLDQMEKKMIIAALDRYEGNRRLASKSLNISERTLYRKIKEYGLE